MGLVDLEKLWFEKRPSLATSLARTSLKPLEALYKVGLSLADRSKDPMRVGCRVISIGNLTVGGNGKTPLVMELAGILDHANKKVAIVSRGYGRSSKGTRVVYVPGSPKPDFRLAGDEPTLMSIRCPYACVVVGEDRADAAGLAVDTWHPDVILCDDAFQHRALYRDLDMLAVHAQRGFGNGRLLPAGPMREPTGAVVRAGLVIFTYAQDESVESLHQRHGIASSVPSVRCSMNAGKLVTVDFETAKAPLPKKVVAASAIANPAGFAYSLRSLGLDVVSEVGWRDHHRVSVSQWARIKHLVDSSGADAVVVTEKDLVCMGGLDLDFDVFALRIDVRWRDEKDRNLVEGLILES